MELDEQLIRDACQKVKVGNDPQRALVALGVPGPLASAWLEEGQHGQVEGVSPDDDMRVRLWAAVDVALADFEATTIASLIGESGKGANWQRFPVALQMRFPDRYGKPNAGSGKGHEKRDMRTLEDYVSELEAKEKKKASG